MAAMGVPTTRSLAAIATGDRVQRERAHPGAVLTRIASSHIRVGTFQFFAAHFGAEHVAQLSDYSIRRHFPDLVDVANPHLALLDRVIGLQCELVAHWLGVGFVHGVMNTDNVAISGETIDYGPCAFMDRFAVETVFSSIDANGRYAYGRQPQIMHWNMARFAEALLPAIHAVDPADVDRAKAMVDDVAERFRAAWFARVRAKLGLVQANEADVGLIDSCSPSSNGTRSISRPFSGHWRSCCAAMEHDAGRPAAKGRCDGAVDRRLVGATETRGDRSAPAGRRDGSGESTLYSPQPSCRRWHYPLAESGDLAPWFELLEVVRNPFAERTEWADYAPTGACRRGALYHLLRHLNAAARPVGNHPVAVGLSDRSPTVRERRPHDPA